MTKLKFISTLPHFTSLFEHKDCVYFSDNVSCSKFTLA